MMDSFAACRLITRQANSSFPLAFRLLSRPKRQAMDALYAFARVTDDLADEPGEVEAKRQKLRQWRTSLEAALAGRYSHPIHTALHHTVQRFEIPTRFLFELIDGVEKDLHPIHFTTFDDLRKYCYQVASTVGLACIRIWGLRPGVSFQAADVPAEAAGIAFQLTNILRDREEDAARGRIYIPEDGTDLLARSRDAYIQAETLKQMLSREGRAIFHVMFGTYRALLERVSLALRSEDSASRLIGRRVAVPRWRKGLIFLSAWPIRWGLA